VVAITVGHDGSVRDGRLVKPVLWYSISAPSPAYQARLTAPDFRKAHSGRDFAEMAILVLTAIFRGNKEATVRSG
jgi:hypothetical protein